MRFRAGAARPRTTNDAARDDDDDDARATTASVVVVVVVVVVEGRARASPSVARAHPSTRATTADARRARARRLTETTAPTETTLRSNSNARARRARATSRFFLECGPAARKKRDAREPRRKRLISASALAATPRARRAPAIATFFVHRCITGFNAYTRVGKYVDTRVAAIAARAARRKFIAFIARARSHDSPTRESREIPR